MAIPGRNDTLVLVERPPLEKLTGPSRSSRSRAEVAELVGGESRHMHRSVRREGVGAGPGRDRARSRVSASSPATGAAEAHHVHEAIIAAHEVAELVAKRVGGRRRQTERGRGSRSRVPTLGSRCMARRRRRLAVHPESCAPISKSTVNLPISYPNLNLPAQ